MVEGSAPRARTRRIATSIPLLLATFTCFSCSGDAETPDAAVRRTLAAIEEAARAKDVGVLEQHVSESYADPQGNDKRAVAGLASFHFLRNQTVYTLTRIKRVEIPEPGRAETTAVVGLAGTAIPDAETLAVVHANLQRFALTLREEEPGTWRVVSATWAPATLDDFR